MNRTRVLLRAAAAAGGLGVLLIGLPALLLGFVGNPLPRHMATWSQVQLAFQSGNIDEQTIVRGIALVVWCVWAWLVWSAAGEAREAIRAYRDGRPIGGHRIVMGRLVVPVFTAAFILLGRAPTPSFAAPLPAVATAPAVATTPIVAGHSLGVVVAPGDTLTSIATRVLGSPNRATQLFQANRGVLQADGGRLSDPGQLRLGWRLALPANNAPSAQSIPTDQRSGQLEAGEGILAHHTVVEGECLSDLAEIYYHDGAQWETIAKANAHLISDPNLIYPGQVLVIPALSNAQATTLPPAPIAPGVPAGQPPTHTNGSTPPASGPSAPAQVPGPQTVRPTVPSPQTGSAHVATAHRTSPAPGRPSGPSAPRSTTPTPAPHSAGSRASSASASAHRLLGGEVALAALLAAGVIRTLMMLRRRQQRRIPLDRRAPPPDPLLVPTEVALRRAANPEVLSRLEVALAALSLELANIDGEVATILGVVADPDGRVKVCLGQPQPSAPEPFKVVDEGQAWELDPAVIVDDDDLDQAEPLMPALVGVGHTATRQEVLVNLEAFGCVSLLGPRAPELLQAWVTELATKAWSECLEVVPVGFGQELASLERVSPAETLEKVKSSMMVHGAQITSLVEDVGESSLLAARLHGSADNWAPKVVCCAQAPSRKELEPVRLALADSARSGVVLAAVGAMSEAGLVLDTSSDEMEVAALKVTVKPHRLETPEAVSIGALMDEAQCRGDVAPDDPAYDLEVSPTRAARELLDAAMFFEDEYEAHQAHAPKEEWSGFDVSANSNADSEAAKVTDGGDEDSAGSRTDEVPVEANDSMAEARELAAQVLEPALVGGAGPGQPSHSHPPIETKIAGLTDGPQDQARDGLKMTETGVEIAVMGPIEVRGADILEGKARELVVYLAVHPEGVPKWVLRQALWPCQEATSDKNFRNMVAAARSQLGEDSSGAPYLPASKASMYLLSEKVSTDWGRFSTLVARGRWAEGDQARDNLREALSLVRGEPFADRGSKSFEWIHGDAKGFLLRTMLSEIAQAAGQLADACLAINDRLGAAWALDRALLACPDNEDLVKRRIEVGEDTKKAAAAFQALRRRSDDDLGDEVLAAYRELCKQGS